MTTTVRRQLLAGFFRLARLGLVTPLRDGMNLVAKEYVAAQDPTDPGVLILSRFAGAAEELTEALIVNPFDAEEIADAMHEGLAMPLAERLRRYARIARARVGHHGQQVLREVPGVSGTRGTAGAKAQAAGRLVALSESKEGDGYRCAQPILRMCHGAVGVP